MRAPAFLFVSLLLGPLVAAQVVLDNFNLPNMTIVPGWTVASGTWAINNKRLVTSGSGWKYITKDGLTATNCVMDGEFFLIGSVLQFGGLTARFASAGSTVMCKIQNNGAVKTVWDRCYIYEKPGISTWKDVPLPRPTSVFCRMIILDNQAWMEVDANKDGIFEMVTGPRVLTTTLGSGKCGMNGYGTTEMDNFEYFDAVLIAAKGSTPKLGTTYKMLLRTPPPPPIGPPGNPYFCLAALSNRGIHFGNRKIPVGYDWKWDLALTNSVIFPGFRGITDKAGAASPSFAIPNSPILVGLGFFVAGFTIDGKKPFGIGCISNEHYIKIVL